MRHIYDRRYDNFDMYNLYEIEGNLGFSNI